MLLFVYALFCIINFAVKSDIVIYSPKNESIDIFNDIPSEFGAQLPISGLTGYVANSYPILACSPIYSPPLNLSHNITWFVLIRRGECDFDYKVLNAQRAGYALAIIYNSENNDLIPMHGYKYNKYIHIPSIFISKNAGYRILERYLYTTGYYLKVTDELPFNLNGYLLPFSIAIGLCFMLMVIFLIIKYVREQRYRMRNRLTASNLKAIPIKKYQAGDAIDTCAVCLEDYIEGDKLRILPCSHAYHSKCIDPWLTKNKRNCPICKRKIVVGKRRAKRNKNDCIQNHRGHHHRHHRRQHRRNPVQDSFVNENDVVGVNFNERTPLIQNDPTLQEREASSCAAVASADHRFISFTHNNYSNYSQQDDWQLPCEPTHAPSFIIKRGLFNFLFPPRPSDYLRHLNENVTPDLENYDRRNGGADGRRNCHSCNRNYGSVTTDCPPSSISSRHRREERVRTILEVRSEPENYRGSSSSSSRASNSSSGTEYQESRSTGSSENEGVPDGLVVSYESSSRPFSPTHHFPPTNHDSSSYIPSSINNNNNSNPSASMAVNEKSSYYPRRKNVEINVTNQHGQNIGENFMKQFGNFVSGGGKGKTRNFGFNIFKETADNTDARNSNICEGPDKYNLRDEVNAAFHFYDTDEGDEKGDPHSNSRFFDDDEQLSPKKLNGICLNDNNNEYMSTTMATRLPKNSPFSGSQQKMMSLNSPQHETLSINRDGVRIRASYMPNFKSYTRFYDGLSQKIDDFLRANVNGLDFNDKIENVSNGIAIGIEETTEEQPTTSSKPIARA